MGSLNNTTMKKLFTLFCLLGMHAWCFAQYPQVQIPGSQLRKLSSAVVGQEYELQVLLPAGYGTTAKKYPVVYLMDSQWDFPLVKSIYGQQYYDGFIPELIVVGVTWGGVNPNPDSLRVRDYTPTNDGNAAQGGHADQFLSFMKTELFPFVESNYQASDSGRILMGCSLGGLFTLYTLFTQPDLFSGYVAASPAIGWDKEALSGYEKQLAGGKLSNAKRVYMTIGDVERSRPAYEKFAAKLTAGKNATTVKSSILVNTGHSGTKSETYTRGLQFVFEKPKLALAPAVLHRYEGRYETGPGNHVQVKSEKGKLVLYVSPTETYPLYAASETEFYSNSGFLNLVFRLAQGKTEGFQLNTYGASRFIRKVE
ncbi:MAG: alpha/beta hydrolase [Chitinophagaceae bacterium]|nr:MAG: alpha/beta hydrolase [Chitinophagaceae bacterium]